MFIFSLRVKVLLFFYTELYLEWEVTLPYMTQGNNSPKGMKFSVAMQGSADAAVTQAGAEAFIDYMREIQQVLWSLPLTGKRGKICSQPDRTETTASFDCALGVRAFPRLPSHDGLLIGWTAVGIIHRLLDGVSIQPSPANFARSVPRIASTVRLASFSPLLPSPLGAARRSTTYFPDLSTPSNRSFYYPQETSFIALRYSYPLPI